MIGTVREFCFICGCEVTSNPHLVLARAWSKALGFAVTHDLHGVGVVDGAKLLSKPGAVLEVVEGLVFVGEQADDAAVRGCMGGIGTGFIKAGEKEERGERGGVVRVEVVERWWRGL